MGARAGASPPRVLRPLYWIPQIPLAFLPAPIPRLVSPHLAPLTSRLLRFPHPSPQAHADELFDFRRLKKSYWMDMIMGAARTGTSASVIANHPTDRGTRTVL